MVAGNGMRLLCSRQTISAPSTFKLHRLPSRRRTMSALEPVPAIRRIDTSRSALAAFDIVGHVSPADVENLFGLLEAAYALEPRVDILLRLIEVDGVDWDEVAPDTISDGKSACGRTCAALRDRGRPSRTGGGARLLPGSRAGRIPGVRSGGRGYGVGMDGRVAARMILYQNKGLRRFPSAPPSACRPPA